MLVGRAFAIGESGSERDRNHIAIIFGGNLKIFDFYAGLQSFRLCNFGALEVFFLKSKNEDLKDFFLQLIQ